MHHDSPSTTVFRDYEFCVRLDALLTKRMHRPYVPTADIFLLPLHYKICVTSCNVVNGFNNVLQNIT